MLAKTSFHFNKLKVQLAWNLLGQWEDLLNSYTAWVEDDPSFNLCHHLLAMNASAPLLPFWRRPHVDEILCQFCGLYSMTGHVPCVPDAKYAPDDSEQCSAIQT